MSNGRHNEEVVHKVQDLRHDEKDELITREEKIKAMRLKYPNEAGII